jgi:hypothetical protein
MDAFFTGLTKRQAMLLLTAVTFGGHEGVEAFEQLPEDERDVLRDRAQQILAIPRDKRVPFLVQEIKRFITGRKSDDLRAVDPKRLAEALAQERPAVIEIILRALPAAVASQARTAMAQPVVALSKEVRADVLAVIRWKFEERLVEILPERASFSVSDLLVLAPRDILCLSDALGASVLAPALAALPTEERETMLKGFPPDQRQLAAKAASAAAAGKKLAPEAARKVLSSASEGTDARAAVRTAGLRRIARACVNRSGEFASRLVERHRGDLGRQLAQLVTDERQAGRRGDDGATAEIIAALESLATRSVIDRPVRLPPPPMRAPRPQAEVPPARTAAPSPPPPGEVRSRPPPKEPPRSPSVGQPATRPPQRSIQRGGAAASSRDAESPAPRPRPSVLRPGARPVRRSDEPDDG